jgi:hypothetical protein
VWHSWVSVPFTLISINFSHPIFYCMIFIADLLDLIKNHDLANGFGKIKSLFLHQWNFQAAGMKIFFLRWVRKISVHIPLQFLFLRCWSSEKFDEDWRILVEETVKETWEQKSFLAKIIGMCVLHDHIGTPGKILNFRFIKHEFCLPLHIGTVPFYLFIITKPVLINCDLLSCVLLCKFLIDIICNQIVSTKLKLMKIWGHSADDGVVWAYYLIEHT